MNCINSRPHGGGAFLETFLNTLFLIRLWVDEKNMDLHKRRSASFVAHLRMQRTLKVLLFVPPIKLHKLVAASVLAESGLMSVMVSTGSFFLACSAVQ